MSLLFKRIEKEYYSNHLNKQACLTFLILVLIPGIILSVNIYLFSLFFFILLLIIIIGLYLTYKAVQSTKLNEKQELENEIMRLGRMNLIGEMAAGIAHEVRNPLTTVHGFLQILRKKENDLKNMDYYDIMISEMERANYLISEFLFCANNRPIALEKQDLNKIITKVYPLINAVALESDKAVHLDLHDLPEIRLNEKEIRQLLLNLVNNGLEAISQGEYVLISTSVCNGNIQMSVMDQGKGIPPEIMERIGSPFLTTKNKGTGLGIAICYSIAARHDATINIDTGPAGTIINIVFPGNRADIEDF